MSDYDIARFLLQLGAVQVRIDPPFQWVSGIKSPVYCDNRIVISYPKVRTSIIEAFKKIIQQRQLTFDVIGGTATAAIPWAAFLAYALDKPMIYIRPEPKDHGTAKQIEGHLETGKKVLIVEDLISTGRSSVKAAMAVRMEGQCTVMDVLAIVSWELPESVSRFHESSLQCHTLTNFTALIKEAVSEGYLNETQYEAVRAFQKDPWVWHF